MLAAAVAVVHRLRATRALRRVAAHAVVAAADVAAAAVEPAVAAVGATPTNLDQCSGLTIQMKRAVRQRAALFI